MLIDDGGTIKKLEVEKETAVCVLSAAESFFKYYLVFKTANSSTKSFILFPA